jgi:hypothetical protein
MSQAAYAQKKVTDELEHQKLQHCVKRPWQRHQIIPIRRAVDENWRHQRCQSTVEPTGRPNSVVQAPLELLTWWHLCLEDSRHRGPRFPLRARTHGASHWLATGCGEWMASCMDTCAVMRGRCLAWPQVVVSGWRLAWPQVVVSGRVFLWPLGWREWRLPDNVYEGCNLQHGPCHIQWGSCSIGAYVTEPLWVHV